MCKALTTVNLLSETFIMPIVLHSHTFWKVDSDGVLLGNTL